MTIHERDSGKELTANAIKVLEKRYLLRDEAGLLIETPDGLFRRVARALSQIESRFGLSALEIAALEDAFFEAMNSHKFLPNSPTLMNAGKEHGQLSACFVLPVPDSLEGIFDTCKNAALIHKTGGGTGFSFSRLRPANDPVSNSVGVASGPISFMTVYDAATEAIRQGGTRRGANMGILRVDHPDIEQFVVSKRQTNKLNNFNISVAVTDQFMKAVIEDSYFSLIHPRSKDVVKTIMARELFELIVENAHATGEPGIIFLDRINADDPLFTAHDDEGFPISGTEDIEATNPCGEQPLGPGDACNLGSINLSEFVEGNDFNWRQLKEMVHLAVRFLDDVIEANHYPMPFIKKAALNNRRVGVGVMGWAEALIKMGISYDSGEACEKAEQTMKFIQEHAHEASGKLAVERGNFPNWAYSKWKKMNVPMRNATVTAIAPTGTISIIAGTSSGIEPLFAISFVRRVLGGQELVEVNELFYKTAKAGKFYSDELMQKIAEQGTLKNVDVPPAVKRLFVSSHDIHSSWHLKMQAAFQKHTDSGVSKTINFPEQATVEDVRQAYLDAWQLGLKGITVYRDMSRPGQVINLGASEYIPHGNKRFCAPGGDCETL